MFEYTENDLGKQTETHGMGESYLLTQKSDFDLKLAKKWSQLMEKGSFRYGLEDICSRIVGGKFGFVAQLQLNRSTNRRPPQAMLSLKQPFSKDKFNFTLINHEKEAIFTLQKTDEKRLGVDQLIINVSPLDHFHCLLTPQVDLMFPQVLTEHAIIVALEVMYLSRDPQIRICFNSLCAFASVNHLHWHIYYHLHNTMYIQTAKLSTLLTSNRTENLEKGKNEALGGNEGVQDGEDEDHDGKNGNVYVLRPEVYPAPAFVFLLRSKNQIQETSRLIHRLTSYLTNSEIAHNVFIIRGSDVNGNGSEYVRVFVWARSSILGVKEIGHFVMAVCELSGQILVYSEEHYKSLKEEEVVEAQTTAVLDTYIRVLPEVEELFAVN